MVEQSSELHEFCACATREERENLLAGYFSRYRPRLSRMVQLRLHPRLRQRIDPSDVIQETYLEAARRLEHYLESPDVPLFLWLRRIASYTLQRAHRDHLKVKARDAGREVRHRSRAPDATSEAMAAQFVACGGSPSDAAARTEQKAAVRNALDGLPPADREILALRFFEQISNAEAAQVLQIKEEAVRKRYLRALQRFKDAIGGPLEPEG